MLSVNRNTQLVIEGFPRSANTTEYSELNIARPSSTRASLKSELIQKLKEPQNHKILQAAEKIYSEFIFSVS